jgi:hypothetical protein
MKMPRQQGPGPAPNTPGGYQWSYPQLTPEQRTQRELTQQQQQLQLATAQQQAKDLADTQEYLRTHPEEAAKRAARAAGAIPTAEQDARNKISEQQLEVQRARNEEITRNHKVMETIDTDKEKDYRRGIDAHIKATKAAGGPSLNSDAVWAAREYVRKGGDIGKVPAGKNGAFRDAVLVSLQGVPIYKKLPTKEQGAWDGIQTLLGPEGTTGIVGDALDTVNQVIKDHPDLADDSGMKGLWHSAQARGIYAKYKYGMKPDDPDRRKLDQATATLTAVGTLGLMQQVGARSSMPIYQDVKIHMPSPSDTPAQTRDKLLWMNEKVFTPQRQALIEQQWSNRVPPSIGRSPGATGGGGDMGDVGAPPAAAAGAGVDDSDVITITPQEVQGARAPR